MVLDDLIRLATYHCDCDSDSNFNKTDFNGSTLQIMWKFDNNGFKNFIEGICDEIDTIPFEIMYKYLTKCRDFQYDGLFYSDLLSGRNSLRFIMFSDLKAILYLIERMTLSQEIFH